VYHGLRLRSPRGNPVDQSVDLPAEFGGVAPGPAGVVLVRVVLDEHEVAVVGSVTLRDAQP